MSNNPCLNKRKTQTKHKLPLHDLRHRHVSLTCAALAGALPAVDEGGFWFLGLKRRLRGEGVSVGVVLLVGGRLAMDPAEGLDLMPGAAVVRADQSAVR